MLGLFLPLTLILPPLSPGKIPSYALYKIVSLIRGGGIPGMPMPAMTQNQGAQNEGMSKTQQKKAARSQGAQSRQRVKTNR